MIVGESYGEYEERINASFVGPSGVELLKMLDEAGVIELTFADRDYIKRWWDTSDPRHIDAVWALHPEIFRTNVFNLRPPKNNIEAFCGPRADGLADYPPLIKAKYVQGQFNIELEELGNEILEHDPNVILALGNTAMWALTGKTAISKIRGTTQPSTLTVSGYKVLGTYHPAAIMRQWELRPIVVADLIKAKRESAYGEIRRPKRSIWIEPSIEDIKTFFNAHVRKARITGVDVETSGAQITCIGFAPSNKLAIVIPFLDPRKLGRSYWPTKRVELEVWHLIKDVLEDVDIKKVFQNGLYDIAFIWRTTGIKVKGAVEDTMLLHHSLQPESLKSLGFMGSVYTDEGNWKVMRKVETIKRDD